jgi:DNA anti-recombination protein RmuC
MLNNIKSIFGLGGNLGLEEAKRIKIGTERLAEKLKKQHGDSAEAIVSSVVPSTVIMTCEVVGADVTYEREANAKISKMRSLIAKMQAKKEKLGKKLQAKIQRIDAAIKRLQERITNYLRKIEQKKIEKEQKASACTAKENTANTTIANVKEVVGFMKKIQ